MQHQVWHVQTAVIRKGLVQRLLGQGNRLRLAFDEHEWRQKTIIHDCVASFLGLAYGDGGLYGYERSGVVHFHHAVQ